MHRRILTSLTVLVSLTVLSACGGGGGGSTSGATTEPLRIGVLVNKAGTLAQSSAEYQAGYEVAAAAAAGALGGRRVELVTAEEDGTPAGTAAAATQLVQQRGVRLITGVVSSAQALAVGPVVTRLGALFVDTSAQGNQLTGSACQAGYFRAVANAAIYSKIVGAAVSASPAKTWSLVVADYAFGNDMAEGVSKAVAEAGGTVNQIIRTPVGNSDFGSAISQLAAKRSDGLFTALPGADSSTFLKQADQFGFLPTYKQIVGDVLLTNLSAGDFANIAPKLQANTVEVSSGYYPQEVSTPANTDYLRRFAEARPGQDINETAKKANNGWNAVQVIVSGVAAARSDDPLAVRKALGGLTIELPLGTAKMRAEDHQLLVPGAIGKIVQENGKWRLAQARAIPADQLVPPVEGCNLG
ncbi:hypothetical protein GCM10009836_44620 [Pseudonocardia ailaonensis]|uniref:Leucine-binding protein domain-containing protein n=1 Tax=Pseudonocardia ailaonensis TaxID=367279 RepID=A0ABN2NB83_9PSEU